MLIMPSKPKPQPPAPSKVMKVTLWLRVENNNKYIRGKKKARQEIEDRVLSRYHMKKALLQNVWVGNRVLRP